MAEGEQMAEVEDKYRAVLELLPCNIKNYIEENHQMDPNFDRCSCFLERYVHSEFKMVKIYYIREVSGLYHRLTVERQRWWRYQGSDPIQRVFLDNVLIFMSDDITPQILWRQDWCDVEIEKQTVSEILWKSISFTIDGRMYKLHNERTDWGISPSVQWKQQKMYGIACNFKFRSLIMLRDFIRFCCTCSSSDHSIPGFLLTTAAWDVESQPVIPKDHQWELQIDANCLIDRKTKWWNYLVNFLDILLFIPCFVIGMILQYSPCWWYMLLSIRCGKKEKQYKYAPAVVKFDVNEARRRFNEFNRTKPVMMI